MRSESHLPVLGETATDAPGLGHLTWRELLANRAMALKAVRRGRNPVRSAAVLARIEAEIERRRRRRRDRLFADVPTIGGSQRL